MVTQLRSVGIRDQRVLEAMGAVERHRFIPAHLMEPSGPLTLRNVYDLHSAIPIGGGVHVSRPLTVAMMSEALGLRAGMRVLEIGSGSGYQLAVLAHIAEALSSATTAVTHVRGIELNRSAATAAQALLHDLGYHAIVRNGDGSLGWPDAQPFDRILFSAATSDRRALDPLLAQLVPDGILVAPVAHASGRQTLTRIAHKPDGDRIELLGEAYFLPMQAETQHNR